MTSWLAGRPVVRLTEQLRVHHALEELGLINVVDEINEATRQKHQPILEPILITQDGTILAGFERWRLALFEGRRQIDCIEYSLREDQCLPFILTHHRPRHGWNAFVRICLALTLEPQLQQKAVDNMRAGGTCKGSASLPEVQRIDVRQEIASIAAVGARNVTKVKKILETAHPRLLEALRDGTLTINRAMQFCRLPKHEQLEQFIHYKEERAVSKVIRGFLVGRKEKGGSLNTVEILDALQQLAVRQPGSVVVRVGRLQHTLILVGQDLLAGPFQEELEVT